MLMCESSTQLYVEADARMDTYEVEDQKRTALNLLQRKTTTEHCDVRILTGLQATSKPSLAHAPKLPRQLLAPSRSTTYTPRPQSVYLCMMFSAV